MDKVKKIGQAIHRYYKQKDIYKLRCYYTIKNINLKETEFKDEDILNNGDIYGLYCMLDTLSEE